MNTVNRGSIWRRWEFHLHTPFTKKEDKFVGKDPDEKWDNFYKSISDYIGDGSDPIKSICAIAITDYLSIDNYIKVRGDKRLPESVKLVFPNVELRLVPMAQKSPINIHCLFDPSIADELSDRFFSNLKFDYNESEYSATRDSLIRLGRVINQNQSMPEDNAYKEGLRKFVIPREALTNIFKKDPDLRKKTIIVVSNNSSDGVSGLKEHFEYFEENKSQLVAVRNSIYSLSDMIFSSSVNDADYFLGRKTDRPEFIKSSIGSLKPCIHGCDAHTNEKVFAPSGDKFCWIKADPTFEGLKQVIYEPAERVRICSCVPDEKPNYNVIDHVEFLSENQFSKEPIYFNDKLTCIIGGKSTGKSLLLNNLARIIDGQLFEDTHKKAGTEYKNSHDMKVYWGDGVCTDGSNNSRKIIYIPQTYLNRLTDYGKCTSEIDNIIKDIILQDDKCKNAHDSMNHLVNEQKQRNSGDIINLFEALKQTKALTEQRKDIGDDKAIEILISHLQNQLDQVSGEFNLDQEKIEQYQRSQNQLGKLNDDLLKYNEVVDKLKEIESIVDIMVLPNFSLDDCTKSLHDACNEVKRIADNKWIEKRDSIINEIRDNTIKSIDDQLKIHQKIIDESKPIIEQIARVKQITENIKAEQDKLNKIKEIDAALANLDRKYKMSKDALGCSFAKFEKLKTEYSENVNQFLESHLLDKDLTFSVEAKPLCQKLSEKILELVDNRSLSKFNKFNIDEITPETLTSENMVYLIESILGKNEESLPLKSSTNIVSALTEIFSDWFYIDYKVAMDNDEIECMSPGKKALVLLRLLISISNSSCPILIDQPEDDLDNRSIFNELIPFLKEKKKNRQIITVTHNANIVLGADAELVIVANQNGSNAQNNHHRFEYRGGSIEDNTLVNKSGTLNSKGIQQHICEILEGGEQAFAMRQSKYNFIKS